MNPVALQLYFARPRELEDGAAAERCLALLSSDELERWRGLRFDRHKREYLATHALARLALSRIAPLAPESWRFAANAHGKPGIAPSLGIEFNLSNAVDLAVCLISRGGPVGVDVEPAGRAASMLEVAGKSFAQPELAALEALGADARADRAHALWTLKEAYIKARGMGLALPLKQFWFSFGADGAIRMNADAEIDANPGRWRFALAEFEAHRIAVMTEAERAPRLEAFAMSLPAGEAVPVALAARWF